MAAERDHSIKVGQNSWKVGEEIGLVDKPRFEEEADRIVRRAHNAAVLAFRAAHAGEGKILSVPAGRITPDDIPCEILRITCARALTPGQKATRLKQLDFERGLQKKEDERRAHRAEKAEYFAEQKRNAATARRRRRAEGELSPGHSRTTPASPPITGSVVPDASPEPAAGGRPSSEQRRPPLGAMSAPADDPSAADAAGGEQSAPIKT